MHLNLPMAKGGKPFDCIFARRFSRSTLSKALLISKKHAETELLSSIYGADEDKIFFIWVVFKVKSLLSCTRHVCIWYSFVVKCLAVFFYDTASSMSNFEG